MWTIANRTAYAAERTWVRDPDGAHRWVVVVKATFTVDERGGVRLADVQSPPLLVPEYHGDPSASSLRHDADLVHDKATTDVVVNAHAHAPRGKPAQSVAVSLRVGALQKVLVVHGTRVSYRGLAGHRLSPAAPFTSRPILYEWAYGGADTADGDPRRQRIDRRNPVGKGFGPRVEDQPAWSVEYPSGDPAKAGPAGFGAIASHWSPRVELAGTYDEAWRRSRSPLLPLDYDPGFALCAPADQRTPRHLQGGEPVELVHMTPDGVLRFALPKVYLTFATWFGRRLVDHRARLATVVVEPEERSVRMSWQTSVPVASRDVDRLDETVVREKPYLT